MKLIGQLTTISILMAPVFAFAMILGALVTEEVKDFFGNNSQE